MNLSLSKIEIFDEDNDIVNNKYLIEILKISKDKIDFVNKVNLRITNEEDYVSISNNMRIQAFFDRYKYWCK